MRKYLLLAIVFFTTLTAFGQDFSNKGKDFWTAYGYHTSMLGANGGSQDMMLYFATDQVTNITVTIASIGWVRTYTSAPGNNIVTTVVIPKNVATGGDACLRSGGLSNNGIHITSDKPMVAYAHIFNGSCSGATILYPTSTLGREYYSVNYKNWSNNPDANCWFYVIATDTGTTTIEITPQADQAGIVTTPSSGNWIAGTTYTVNLTQGQIYNVMGVLTTFNNPYKGVDLTGSKIKSINNGSGCKKIGVFSGSGRISITCTNGSSSSDNYMVQAMPKNAWGKKYLTVPANGNQANNIFRVCVSSPAAVVKINGVVTALPLQNNFYYEIPSSNQPQLITADSAIMVAQYFTSQGACGNGSPGDPEVIYLSAVEQNINKVIWNATSNFLITSHSLSVVIPNTGTALSSFRLNGAAVGGWVTHPQDPGYSYLRTSVGTGFNIIQSDSGFNATAYGFGTTESYGYNAGTNIKDLYQQIGVQTQYGIESTPSVCTNSPFKFKVSLPYIPDSMHWDFHGAVGMSPNNNTVYVDNTGNIAEDSFTIVNGKTIHWYSVPLQYTFSIIGTYPVTITTFVPNGECGSVQDIDFDLGVSDPPLADFAWTAGGCVAETYQFNETTPQFPKATYKIWWDFGDPASGGNNNSILRNPAHLFSSPGTYTVRYAAITTPGCLSDTITHTVTVAPIPSATISGSTPAVCLNTLPEPFITFTGTDGTAPYIFSYNINGGPTLNTVPSVGGISTVTVPTNVAGPLRYNLMGVRNQNPAATLCTRTYNNVFVDVMINPLPVAAISGGTTVCLNNPPTTPVTFTGSGGTAPYTFNYDLNGVPQTPVVSNAAGIYVINAPTNVAGPFNYTITSLTDASSTLCSNTSGVTTTINVDDDATIALTSPAGTDNQTKCINTVIDNIDYLVARGGTGATIAWGLPAGAPPGINFTSLGGNNFRISGTPTAAGSYSYTVSTTGPCIKPTATGTLIVTPDATVTLRGGDNDNQTVCINNPIADIRYDIGGSGNGGTVTGLPAGMTYTYLPGPRVITITGAPTTAVGSPFTYAIHPTGPCAIPVPDVTGTITVTEDGTLALTSAIGTDAQKLCKNSPIVDITYVFGQSATGASVSGLPPGVTWSVTGNTVTITGSPTVSLPAAYTYTVSTTGPCITPSLSGTILVDELPTPAFSYTIPTCDTRTISFADNSVPNTGTIVSWAWNFGDPTSPNNTDNIATPTHVFTAANTTPGYNVTLIVTTSEGCSNAVPFPRIVTVNHRPVAGFIVPDVCINDVATPFTDTSKIAVGTINRAANEWLYNDPFATPGNPNTSTGVNGLHLYTATGVYPVRQIVTSSLGCRDTITIPITINSADPVAAFTPANSCSSDSASIINQSTVGFGSVTRIDIYWDVVGAPGVFQTILNPIPNGIYRHKYPTLQTTTNYSVRIVAYSGVICFNNSAPKPLIVYATPVVQFNVMPASCLLIPPFQITQASEIGGVPGTGTFSGGPYITGTGIFDPQIAGVGTHPIKFTWTASNPGACIDTLTRFITVLDTAHAKFSVVTPICEGVPASFTDLSTAPAGVIMDHTIWNFGDGSPTESHSPPGVTFTHPFALPGTFTVTMHSVSQYGCLSTDTSMSVTVGANHSIGLAVGSGSPTQTVCINKPIVPITYNLGGGANNVSIPSLPAGLGYLVNGAGTSVTISGAPTSTVGSPFNFTVLTSGNTCTGASANISITVNPDHTIAFNSGDTMQSVCVNTPIDNIVYNLGGGATGISIVPGGNLPPGVNAAVSGNTVTISGTPTATGTYNYNIQTTGNACVKANVIGQIVVHPYPVPSFTVDKPAYCIPNAIVKFTNGSTTPNGSAMTYVWTFGDGSPQDFSVSPTHWYTSGIGPFTVRLSATSIAVPVLNGGLQGCNKFIDVPMISIHPQPKAGFVFSKPSVCIGDQVTITDATDGRDGIVNEWHWDLGDGSKERINPVTHTYGDTITYIITMYTVNSFGCNSDTINVLPLTGPPINPFSVYPYPHVNAGPDKSVLEGGSVVLEGVTFANDPQYNWTPALYLTDAHITRPRVMNPKSDMTYRLTVTGRGGCQLSDDVFVKLLRFPVIPNTFTPNNDGRNDTWRIDFLNTYPDNRVQIFTRSGKLVFESRGYNTPWDGTLKGKPLPFDTYYYIIEPGNGRDPITGYVTILK